MKSESAIQSEIRVELSKLGYIVFRMQSGTFLTMDGKRIVNVGVPGMSDLIVISPSGQAVWIETKRVGGKKGGEQKNFIAAMRKQNALAGFANSVDSAIAITKGEVID